MAFTRFHSIDGSTYFHSRLKIFSGLVAWVCFDLWRGCKELRQKQNKTSRIQSFFFQFCVCIHNQEVQTFCVGWKNYDGRQPKGLVNAKIQECERTCWKLKVILPIFEKWLPKTKLLEIVFEHVARISCENEFLAY